MWCSEFLQKKVVVKLAGRYIYLNVFRLFDNLLTQCTVMGTHLVKA